MSEARLATFRKTTVDGGDTGMFEGHPKRRADPFVPDDPQSSRPRNAAASTGASS